MTSRSASRRGWPRQVSPKSLLLPVLDGAPNGVIYEENCNRASDGYKQTVQIQAAHSAVSEHVKHPSSNDRTSNTKTDIEYWSLAPFIYDLASDETREQT